MHLFFAQAMAAVPSAVNVADAPPRGGYDYTTVRILEAEFCPHSLAGRVVPTLTARASARLWRMDAIC